MTRSLADRVVATAALLFVAALQVHRIDDSDTWWHLATGRLIAATGSVPRVDPFSYAAAGTPWINRQWLFEIGLYGLWRAAGPAGIALGTGVLFLAAFACAYRGGAPPAPGLRQGGRGAARGPRAGATLTGMAGRH